MKDAVIKMSDDTLICNKISRFPCPVDDPIHAALLETITSRATKLGWSSNRIAKEAGLSKGNWSEINNKKKSPRLSSIEKLCSALGIKVVFESINPVSLPDASGLWWQWYQGAWRPCHAAYSRHDERWEYRWVNADYWFRCQPGFFTRCDPPQSPPNSPALPPTVGSEEGSNDDAKPSSP